VRALKKGYINLVLDSLNILYLALWAVYIVAMFLWYWFAWAPAGDLVGWFRATFGVLGFNFEAVSDGSVVIASRLLTFLDWVARTIWRDFVTLSLAASIIYLIQRKLSKK